MDNMNLENKEALQQKLETLRAKDGFICDMDGVIYHGNRLLPGSQGICRLALSGEQALLVPDELVGALAEGIAAESWAAWALDVDEEPLLH